MRMMRRSLLAALPFPLLLVLAACGGGSGVARDTDSTPGAGETVSGDPTVVPTPTDVPLPAPTAVPSDFIVLQVANAGSIYAPTRAEFLDLAQTELTQGGTTYSGVSLAALAAEVGARDGAIVTIEGTRSDNRRYGAIRFTLSEIGENTVLTISEDGHIDLASTYIPTEQWLFTVTGVVFD